jgi:hypothetical protein
MKYGECYGCACPRVNAAAFVPNQSKMIPFWPPCLSPSMSQAGERGMTQPQAGYAHCQQVHPDAEVDSF